MTKISSDSFDLLRGLESDAIILSLPLGHQAIDRSSTALISKWADIARLADNLFLSPDGRNSYHNFLRFFSRAVLSSHIAAPELCLDHAEKDFCDLATFVDNGRAYEFWDHCMVYSLVGHTGVHLEGQGRDALEDGREVD